MGLFRQKHKQFGQIVIERGLASQADIEDALKIQSRFWTEKKIQKQIGAILHEKGLISTEDIKNIVEEQRRMDGLLLKSFVYWMFHSK